MRSTLTALFLISMLGVNAQSDELQIQGQTGNLYLTHAVVAKETWYSVGRMYNIDPKLLARYNQLTFAHPLGIGQELKVPLTAGNFSQDGKKQGGESLVPVFHIVQEKEWLYRISVNHNKVPIPVLEKWNHVTGDQVHTGLHMIVGYLKVKTTLSALAKQGVAAPVIAPPVIAPPAAAPPTATDSAGQDATATPAARAPVVKAPAVKAPVVQPPVVQHSVAQPPLARSQAAPQFNGGKFRNDYTDGGRSVTGMAGIFKSASGWQDGKYYALINNVAVGTIVKITDQSTGKSVFAKVLGQLPDMRESAGLTVRMSNAAAAELGEGELKFGVGVSY